MGGERQGEERGGARKERRGREGGARRRRGHEGRGEAGDWGSVSSSSRSVLGLSHQRIICKGDKSQRLFPYRSAPCSSPSGGTTWKGSSSGRQVSTCL